MASVPSANRSRIREVAIQVRGAIESIPLAERPLNMAYFPAGACADTSHILGTFLENDCGLGKFELISADRGDKSLNTWTSHAWLLQGDLTIDITADQFADAPGPIVVSVDSQWHQSFDVLDIMPSNIKDWHGPGMYDVTRMYWRIRRVILESGT